MTSSANPQEWVSQARGLLQQGVMPQNLVWGDQLSLLPLSLEAPAKRILVPPEFLKLLPVVLSHRSLDKHSLLYRLLWRFAHGEPHLLQVKSDPDVIQLEQFSKAVRRDLHKMHAFVRFRRVEEGSYVAWYEPDHLIVNAAAPFFARRFGDRPWSILTPDACAHWDLKKLVLTPGLSRESAPREDQLEDLWRTYYGSIFNPARIKIKAMQREMPRKRWMHLPECSTIARALQDAPHRLSEMARMTQPSARPFVPESLDYDTLKTAALSCHGCTLCEKATQSVFGEGSLSAQLMIVGEQPGDQEDRTGKPFVGPAGQLFEKALFQVGVDRSRIYLTNAVKHFKYAPRGKFRLHQKPSNSEISACRPWLQAELAMVKPRFIVCLGATAAQSVLGRVVKIGDIRGRWISHGSAQVLVTVHPSAILRQSPERQAEEFERFVEDLKLAFST